MFIDSHMHVNFMGYSADDIIAYMDRNGIDQCWLLTLEEINPLHPYPVHSSLEEVWEAYERYPSRIVPMYAPDPNRPDAAERLRAWHKKGIRGCGELKVSLNWDSVKLDPLLSCISELGIPIIFHMEVGREFFVPSPDSSFERLLASLFETNRFWGLPRKAFGAIATIYRPLNTIENNICRLFPGYMLSFASLEARLKEYPKVNIVGHGPLFWQGISSDLGPKTAVYPEGPVVGEGITCRLLSQYENLYADLSGGSGINALTRDPKFAKYFISKYEHKILYGTDNFSIGLREFLDGLKLPEKTYKLIYGDNAVRLIK
jgi:predicted TIM-barrel fold metal-dependent hydrolase